jgi:hypothetical protein
MRHLAHVLLLIGEREINHGFPLRLTSQSTASETKDSGVETGGESSAAVRGCCPCARCATLQTVVQSAFLWVVVVVCVVGVVGAIIALLTSRRDWAQYGSDRLLLDSELPRAPAGQLERDQEVRQMLEARNARRRRRGEPEVDIETELARLTALADADGELRDEIRQLVIARNHRRARKGLAPLDVEAEIARELAGLRDV